MTQHIRAEPMSSAAPDASRLRALFYDQKTTPDAHHLDSLPRALTRHRLETAHHDHGIVSGVSHAHHAWYIINMLPTPALFIDTKSTLLLTGAVFVVETWRLLRGLNEKEDVHFVLYFKDSLISFAVQQSI